MTGFTVRVAGAAGQGVKTASAVLSRLLARAGYHVFAYPDVMSRIRGGHNFTTIRAAETRVFGPGVDTDVLLALGKSAAEPHLARQKNTATVLTDDESIGDPGGGQQVVRIPFGDVAGEVAGERGYAGSVALGALVALVGQPLGSLEQVLRESFRAKGRGVVRASLKCARAGFRRVSERSRRSCRCDFPKADREPLMLLNGNQAVGYGALAAGVRLYAGYPMSPATGVMEYLAGKQRDFDLVVEQAEDEIAAVSICLGAAYAGVRAMTATSGGGFALMVEGLGYSAMAELPLVIVVCQRPGPATGFPTRTEQGELLYTINASQDEFPRFVFAPGTAEQACYATVRAFELASRYQVPAIVLSDQHLADSMVTIPEFDGTKLVAIDDFSDEDVASDAAFTYRRYALTDDGVSRRMLPGHPEQLVRVMGSEHDESGLPTEDATNRGRMQDKRMRKTGGMRRELDGVEVYPDDGERDAVVCFGSTYGAVREAVDRLQASGVRVGMIHFQDLCPFPREQVLARLGTMRRILSVEQNATGQLARLIARETRIEVDERILKYDGRPFSGSRLADTLRELL